MENEINTWLEDINQAIEEIYLFLPEKRNFFEFQKDLKGKRAIERSLEIIGEAVHRILKVNPEFPITHARKIVDTRNRISHGYDKVSDDIVWEISEGLGQTTNGSQKPVKGINTCTKNHYKQYRRFRPALFIPQTVAIN